MGALVSSRELSMDTTSVWRGTVASPGFALLPGDREPPYLNAFGFRH
jgi:hypothetical protein